MVTLDREEREERIEEDDGNLEDTVHIAYSGYKHGYHGDSECHRLKSCETREATREDAQREGLVPCRTCVVERETAKVGYGGYSKLEVLMGKGPDSLRGGSD